MTKLTHMYTGSEIYVDLSKAIIIQRVKACSYDAKFKEGTYINFGDGCSFEVEESVEEILKLKTK